MSNSLWPMDCSPPGSPVHGISQARILRWVAISFSKGSSQPRDQTHISCIGRQIPLSHQGSPNQKVKFGKASRTEKDQSSEFHHSTVTMGLKWEENPWITHARCLNEENQGNPKDDREGNRASNRFQENQKCTKNYIPRQILIMCKDKRFSKKYQLWILLHKSHSKTYAEVSDTFIFNMR